MHTLDMAHDREYAVWVAVAMKAAAYYRSVSTEELADRIGVHVETVRRWMRAQNVLSAEDASLVASALDIPGDLLMRPPESRERALAMIAAWDGLRGDGLPPAPPPRRSPS